ncbi:MAG: 50S ribosomal protein L5 [Spirochaetes bacterium GWF1_31_7]|nr:MAG: 50S ribosomal protein L5 [Spirochaetes bacterium GWE1_32_154]OHD47369.1 MAG: 50S ribosomal protein L5 [Spirochaetes bacterium GWF1_31_7]OHD77888.1 MAG: 50S ribosomal protein L5 [Spirochaetes bacterium RIFOXYB1_FULL_32_8]HBD92822.1 50S ribosomal protein L5 [Spirochaetia bacterium]HBI37329.1 50S ribosomal protein L5 [Spirochaetia bacterium]
MIPNLKKQYNEVLSKELMKENNYKNVMLVPKLQKIVLSMGVGTAIVDKKKLESAVGELSLIAGQKAVKTKAKTSIAGFKLREGMEIGCKVTLRGDTMYIFLEKLINIALPRVKDFKGVKASGFDGRGSFSMGITEHLIFPEIDFDKIDDVKGLNVTFVTNTKNDSDTKKLLEKFRMPFVKK